MLKADCAEDGLSNAGSRVRALPQPVLVHANCRVVTQAPATCNARCGGAALGNSASRQAIVLNYKWSNKAVGWILESMYP